MVNFFQQFLIHGGIRFWKTKQWKESEDECQTLQSEKQESGSRAGCAQDAPGSMKKKEAEKSAQQQREQQQKQMHQQQASTETDKVLMEVRQDRRDRGIACKP